MNIYTEKKKNLRPTKAEIKEDNFCLLSGNYEHKKHTKMVSLLMKIS